MKIIFTTKGTDWNSEIDARFGRTEFFVVYDEQKDELLSVDNRVSGQEAHGAGPKTASKIAEQNPDILITGNGPGGNAETALRALNIEIFVGAAQMTVRQAYEAYKNHELKKF